MGRLIKYLFILVLIAFVGLLGFSYFGDLSAPQTEVTVVVQPDNN